MEEIGTSATSFSCNWQNYDLLMLCSTQYNNVCETVTVPTLYFRNTGSGDRPRISDTLNNVRLEAWQNGEGSITAVSTTSSAIIRLRIYGVKFS